MMDKPPPTDPRLQTALDELARSVAKLDHLLSSLEWFDGELKGIAHGLQIRASAVAAVHARTATIVALQKADTSAREAGQVNVVAGQEKTSATTLRNECWLHG